MVNESPQPGVPANPLSQQVQHLKRGARCGLREHAPHSGELLCRLSTLACRADCSAATYPRMVAVRNGTIAISPGSHSRPVIVRESASVRHGRPAPLALRHHPERLGTSRSWLGSSPFPVLRAPPCPDHVVGGGRLAKAEGERRGAGWWSPASRWPSVTHWSKARAGGGPGPACRARVPGGVGQEFSCTLRRGDFLLISL
jgi:hypothetical protein